MTTLGQALDTLIADIDARASADPKASYTASLLAAGVHKCAKKLGEEAVETALAAVSGDKQALANEAADLLYHLIVTLKSANADHTLVAAALATRRGVSGHDEKANRT